MPIPQTGIDLDREMRAIFSAVTQQTALSSAAKLVALGFGSLQAIAMVRDILRAKEKLDDPM